MGNIVTKLGAWCVLACQCATPSGQDEMHEQEQAQPLLMNVDDAIAKHIPSPHQQSPMNDPTRSLESPISVERTPRRRALLIGIRYTEGNDEGLHSLKGSHKDVISIKKLLIEHYGYLEKNVTVMMDAPSIPAELQPNKINVKREMRELVRDAVPGDRFAFVFSGHSDQRVEKQGDNVFPEEDGMDEVIITMDGKKIRDNKLYKIMVQPLPPGAGLFALIDSCHSGTMLDLPHNKCNAIYVPWISKGRRRSGTLRMNQIRGMAFNATLDDMPTFSQVVTQGAKPSASRKLWVDTAVNLAKSDSTSSTGSPFTGTQNSITGSCLATSPIYDSPDVHVACTGMCHYDEGWRHHRPDVVSLSACSDLQQAWEDSKGRSLAYLFCNFIKDYLLKHGKPPTYKELMTHINYRLYEKSVKLHRWTMKEKRLAKSEGRSYEGGEAVNFQTPELSSLATLNIDESFRL